MLFLKPRQSRPGVVVPARATGWAPPPTRSFIDSDTSGWLERKADQILGEHVSLDGTARCSICHETAPCRYPEAVWARQTRQMLLAMSRHPFWNQPGA